MLRRGDWRVESQEPPFWEKSVHRKVELEEVQAWLKEQRRLGSVGVLMRVNSTSEMREAGQLPPGGKRYYKGSLELIIYSKSP